MTTDESKAQHVLQQRRSPAGDVPTRYPTGTCPVCQGGSILYTGYQVVGVEEDWEDGDVVDCDTRDWEGWIGAIHGRCLSCGHQWEE